MPSPPPVSSAQQWPVLCVAGVQWRTSVFAALSVRAAPSLGDGSPALTSASLSLSLPLNSSLTHPPLYVNLNHTSNPVLFPAVLLQLNVTVEPGLPEDLTYNCSFSATGENLPVVVPAVELVANTQYQCDITGSVTALDSVQQGSLLCFQLIDLQTCSVLYIEEPTCATS